MTKPTRAIAPVTAAATNRDVPPPEPEPSGETLLPQLKPPPEFEAKPSDNPYKEKNDAPSSSDNPY